MLAGLALALKSDQGQGKSKGSSQAQGRLAPAVPSSTFLQLVLGASKPERICCKKMIERPSLPCPSPCPLSTWLFLKRSSLVLGVPACHMQMNPDR